MAENRPKRGRKVRSISNSGQKVFYVIKPKIDNFIPPTPPSKKKKTPLFFWGGGSTVKCQLSGRLFNMSRFSRLYIAKKDNKKIESVATLKH